MCIHVCACVVSHFNHVGLCVTVRIAAHQDPLSKGFSRQEYWSGFPCPPPGDPPDTCVYIYIHMCVCKLNNFSVHQKLTQHCKSTILKFKNYFFKKETANCGYRGGEDWSKAVVGAGGRGFWNGGIFAHILYIPTDLFSYMCLLLTHNKNSNLMTIINSVQNLIHVSTCIFDLRRLMAIRCFKISISIHSVC